MKPRPLNTVEQIDQKWQARMLELDLLRQHPDALEVYVDDEQGKPPAWLAALILLGFLGMAIIMAVLGWLVVSGLLLLAE